MPDIKEPEITIPGHWEAADPFPEYGSVGSFIPHESPDGRLWLRYYRDRNDRTLKALAWFGPGAEGAPGRIHGGSVSAIMDEALGAAAWLRGLSVVTATLRIKYRRPLNVGTLCELVTEITKIDKRRIQVRGSLRVKGGDVVAEAEGVYFRLPDSELTDKLAKIMAERREAEAASSTPAG